MNKFFNIILLGCVLILLYQSVQKYKIENVEVNYDSDEEKEEDNKSKKEHFNSDRIYKQDVVEPQKIKFNYDSRPIDKQFLEEQKYGANLKSWVPNTWIERVDEDGNPVYNSRSKVTGNLENFIEEKARFSYEFNEPKTYNMNGIIDPNELVNNEGKTLKEIYDSSFVDYKKLIPKKNMKEVDSSELISSNWEYDDEKAENGGEISQGLYASDPYYISTVSFENEFL
jgi:hypothetical protein